tara:strand:+ start:539 stop:772 length:234 start_codon:yes stop_codon:yes gene_type:complete
MKKILIVCCIFLAGQTLGLCNIAEKKRWLLIYEEQITDAKKHNDLEAQIFFHQERIKIYEEILEAEERRLKQKKEKK